MLTQFTEGLFDNFPDIDNLNFVLICRRAADDRALSFFTHLASFRQAVLLRVALGRLSVTHARLVLLFLFSGLRWRISRVSLKTCPFCPRHELLWFHFFECECASPYLNANFLGMDILLRYARSGRWLDVFSVIGEVLMIWCDLMSTCALDVDDVQALAHLP